MYVQVETDKAAIYQNGAIISPVATLEDQYGGKCQITKDDGCYKINLRKEDGKYYPTPHIFPEAFLVLRELPILPHN